MTQLLIAGGGIGGLAAALAGSMADAQVRLYERTPVFSEVGAGVQLGPNVTRVLHGWGLAEALNAVVAVPQRLQIRSAASGAELGVLRLGEVAQARYGSPYVTIHRGDLHAVLLAELTRRGQVALHLESAVVGFEQDDKTVTLRLQDGREAQGDLLVGADGGWSRVRQQLLNDGGPSPTGHLAYRALVRQSSLPQILRSQQVTAWLGPHLHMVQYPVRRGEWLNVVAFVHGHVDGDMQSWDHSANAAELQRHMAGTCAPMKDLINAIEHWRLWPLSIRAPMQGAHEHAQWRVALLGDAAHPMLPYLAQGAGMAIEDAAELGRILAAQPQGTTAGPEGLREYAAHRWHRNARVQARAIRNGQIFHATGLLRWGRDVAMKLRGEPLLDMPWLYGKI